MYRQAQNLISLKIDLPSGLKIHMVTEAGIIGKIGMNSSGVGCTLNAVKAHGVSYDRLPCHLALRTVLESPSKNAALEILNKEGVVSLAIYLSHLVKGNEFDERLIWS